MTWHRQDRRGGNWRVATGGALLASLVLCSAAGGCDLKDEAQASQKRSAQDERVAKQLPPLPRCPPKGAPVHGTADFQVPPPPFSKGIYPCMSCHEGLDPNPKRRVLKEEHTQIKLNHGPRERWCFDCHNPKDRNYLRLASGAKVAFTESWRLCGQCHGPKLRDWRHGVHGRRYGRWNGPKCYLLCAHCHDPHNPHFKPLEPLPPPHRSKSP